MRSSHKEDGSITADEQNGPSSVFFWSVIDRKEKKHEIRWNQSKRGPGGS